MTAYDEQRLGEILAALPPAPEAWVRAAQDFPLLKQSLDEIIERAETDDDYRRRVIADPAGALEEADVVAHADAVEILRRKLEQ